MSMTADRPARHSASLAPAQRLRSRFAAARLSFTWLGVRKSLSADQKAQAAESFGAQGQFLCAAKKLLDTRSQTLKALSSVKGRITSYWKALSLPYPEPGLRLIRQEDIEPFHQRMQTFQAELAEAVEQLESDYESLQSAARDRLGRLYDPADYPPSLKGLFEVSWEFPSVEPPEYLLRLNPRLYEQEKARICARFEEAVALAEQAFTAELAKLVEHLVERLGSSEDGQKKVFRDSAISNLGEFFRRFKSLSVHSNPDLDRLVETAQQAIAGIQPQALRDSAALRQRISSQLSSVAASLDQMLVDAPRRRILRQNREGMAT